MKRLSILIVISSLLGTLQGQPVSRLSPTALEQARQIASRNLPTLQRIGTQVTTPSQQQTGMPRLNIPEAKPIPQAAETVPTLTPTPQETVYPTRAQSRFAGPQFSATPSVLSQQYQKTPSYRESFRYQDAGAQPKSGMYKAGLWTGFLGLFGYETKEQKALNLALAQAIRDQDLQKIKELVRFGANANAIDKYTLLPLLTLAIVQGHPDVVKELLAIKGINVYAEVEGAPVLTYAINYVSYHRGEEGPEILKELLKKIDTRTINIELKSFPRFGKDIAREILEAELASRAKK